MLNISSAPKTLAALLTVLTIYSAPTLAIDANPVVLTFSTVGDSRQDPKNIDASLKLADQVGIGNCPTPSGTGLTPNPGLSGQDCKWLQSTKAWSRMMRSIQSQKPKLLFFNGDMIMGYGKATAPVTRTADGVGELAITAPTVDNIVTSDLMQFYQQYGFWRGMVSNMMETGTYVVPVPGNHETQCKRCGKTSQVENENAWRDNMGDLVLDTARFTSLVGTAPQNWNVSNTPGADDGITTDQKQLSYSFDIAESHFVVINTDAVGKDGYAPSKWLDADLTTAEKNGAKRFFVFGHKPAYYYLYAGATTDSSSSLDAMNLSAANDFWNVVAKHKATYFCGHEHIYHVDKINATDNSGNWAYQVIVGTGGSPFDVKADDGVKTDRMYTWATVGIRQNGQVVMNTYGFDDTISKPAKLLETIKLPTR